VSTKNQLTNSMEHSLSSEVKSFSASQDIPHILWKLDVQLLFVQACHFFPSLDRSNAVHTPPSYDLKIHFNINLPSTPRSSMWFLSLRFPLCILHAPLLFPICATCTAHLILLDLGTQIIFSEKYRLWSFLLYNLLPSPVTYIKTSFSIHKDRYT
jgi:hypothetical protein